MAGILDCKKIQAGLSEYIDEALPPNEQEATRQHLRSCAVCAQIEAELTQTARLLALLPRSEPSQDFERALTARLAGQALRPKPTNLGERLAAWWSLPRVRPAALSGLAVACLVPVVLLLRLPPRTPHSAVPLVAERGGAENAELEQALQEHVSAKATETFGDASGVLLASAQGEREAGS